MRVLLITPDFPPILKSSARLFYELAEDLSRAGHRVRVMTRIPDAYVASQTKGKGFRLFHRENTNNIKVWRLKGLPLPRRIPLARALEQWWMSFTFTLAGLVLPRQDAVIVYSPPLPLTVTGYMLSRWWRCPLVINIQDLYPQTAIDLGLLRNRLLIGIAHKVEQLAYRKADAITVHSEGNREYVVQHGAPAERVHVVYNWVDLNEALRGPQSNPWRQRHGLNGVFLVSFGGTMGFAQGLEEIVQAAERLRQYSDIAFVLAGDGVLRPFLKRTVQEKNLTNVHILSPQPSQSYLELLEASDVCLVTLHKDLKTPVVPGKLQSIMAAGRAVLCSTDAASDAKRIVDQAGCGAFVPAGHPEEMAEAVRAFYNDKKKTHDMGMRGRQYAERNFNRTTCVLVYTSLLSTFQERKGRRKAERKEEA